MTSSKHTSESDNHTKHHKKKEFLLPMWFKPFVGLCFGLILAFFYSKITGKPIISSTPIRNIFIASTPTPTPGPKPLSIVLLGYGGPDHDGGYLTDTLIQVVIRPEDKKILMISIPRDLTTKIPVSATDTIEEKINAAFAIGIDDKDFPNKPDAYKATTNAGAISEKLIGDVTGIPVNSYLALSFDGFIKAIDTLGGVDVYFDQPFDDYRYPIRGKETDTCGMSPQDVATLSATLQGDDLESKFECRYEHVHVDKGLQHLNGELALKVARSRHSLNLRGDFSRSDRQRQIIQAAKEKVFQIGFLPKAIPFFISLGKDVKSDIDLNFVTSMFPFAQDFRQYSIVSISLSDENVFVSGTNSRGQYVLQPKDGSTSWDLVHAYIAEEATKSAEIKTATPSGSAK